MPAVARNLRRLGADDPLIPRFGGIARQAWVANQHRLLRFQPTLRALVDAGVRLAPLPPDWLLVHDASAVLERTAILACALHPSSVDAATRGLGGSMAPSPAARTLAPRRRRAGRTRAPLARHARSVARDRARVAARHRRCAGALFRRNLGTRAAGAPREPAGARVRHGLTRCASSADVRRPASASMRRSIGCSISMQRGPRASPPERARALSPRRRLARRRESRTRTATPSGRSQSIRPGSASSTICASSCRASPRSGRRTRRACAGRRLRRHGTLGLGARCPRTGPRIAALSGRASPGQRQCAACPAT